MKDRLELWVLRAAAEVAAENIDPGPLRGLLHLAEAAEDIGDQAQQMVALIEDQADLHPILGLALGESDEVVMKVPVAAGSPCDGRTLAELQLDIEPGFDVLAIRRGGGYLYRPGGLVALQPDDELITVGPEEGRPLMALRCGWLFEDDDETGTVELVPTTAR